MSKVHRPQLSTQVSTALMLTIALIVTGCSATSTRRVEWQPVVCYEARAPIERIRCGRPDPFDPHLQAVSVDQAGDVALMHFGGTDLHSEVIYHNGSEMTGLVLSDIDARLPGEEIYAGGYAGGDAREGTGGVVVQISLAGESQLPAIRRVYEGPDYVHSVERVEPQKTGDSPHLLVSTYAGEIHLLTPTGGAGPWDDRLLYREQQNEDPEAVKIKDVAFLVDRSGRAPHQALVALKTGRTLCFDLDHPDQTELIHTEPGGLSRVTSDGDGGAYITGYWGRVLHFVPAERGFDLEVLVEDGIDSGLRGLVRGKFPVDESTTANMVVFGFHNHCRALVSHVGVVELDSIFVDIDKGHAIEVAELVPGNGADELLLGGYSKRVTMIVARHVAQ